MVYYRTESLFHYTYEKGDLMNILKEGCLYPNYCGEELSTVRYADVKIGIPMICFCDIPISLASSHSDRYGKYAIGLKKEWGIENGCNPVLYVTNEKVIDAMIFFVEMWKEYRKTFNSKDLPLGKQISQFNKILDSNTAKAYELGFVKKYDGFHKGESQCNYDENEWRYIIEDGMHDIMWMWEKGEYDLWKGAEKPAPTEEMKNLGLKFKLEDVNHIILPKNEDAPMFIKDLQKQMNATEDEMSILLKKITTL